MSQAIQLHYQDIGQGVPVVLLHGFPLNHSIWKAQLQALSTQYRVIAPDLRGHGQSRAPEGIYEMDLMAIDIVKLLDDLKISEAAIFGHSLGGYVTLSLWKLAPERFWAIGLIGSHASEDSAEAKLGRYQLAEKVAQAGPPAVADALLPKVFASSDTAAGPLGEQVRKMILQTSPTGIIGALKGMASRRDTAEMLYEVNCPVLILAGENDQLMPGKAQAISMAMPKAKLALIPQAGHLPMFEQPELTSTALLDFLQSLDSQEVPTIA